MKLCEPVTGSGSSQRRTSGKSTAVAPKVDTWRNPRDRPARKSEGGIFAGVSMPLQMLHRYDGPDQELTANLERYALVSCTLLATKDAGSKHSRSVMRTKIRSGNSLSILCDCILDVQL